jgi:hypothetical protein
LQDERATIEILTHLEEALWRAEIRFDTDLVSRTFAEDFFEFGRSGRHWSRNDLLDGERQPIEAVLPLISRSGCSTRRPRR